MNRSKILCQKNDRSLSKFYEWYKKERLALNPDWQRNYVWNEKKASLLIESFLMEIPVPLIYLAETNESKYEVIDGQQRLSSVFKFFDNEYNLRGLKINEDLNGCYFRDLKESLQDKLSDRILSSIELPAGTPNNLMFELFERLNTGGVNLNKMEVRNCVYGGKLIDLVKELAGFNKFLLCVSQKSLSKRMKDRELVLRFLAFHKQNYGRSGLTAFLNEFCEYYRNASDKTLNEFRSQFRKAINASFTIFGDKGFRLDPKSDKGFKASIFQVMTASFADYKLEQLTRSADAIFEEYLNLVQTDSRWVEYVSNHTSDYSRITYAFDTWKQNLKEAVKNSEPNDSKRCFSRALKEELFEQNNTCKLCNQKISHIHDAAIDHIEHYWRGGRTVPENARLVHRDCNQRRPN